MAYDSSKPVTGGSLVAADMRENFRALKEDDIVEGVAASGITPAMFSADSKQSVIKAWINFNGTGVIAINDSFNVTSITDNGTGDYTITWDTDFANINYAIVAMGRRDTNDDISIAIKFGGTYAVGSVQIQVVAASAYVAKDASIVNILAMGDQ